MEYGRRHFQAARIRSVSDCRWDHKKGDKAFTKWEGTHKTSIKEDKSWETIIEGKIEFIGGTGMFENIEGGGTYNCSATAKGGTCDAELEAEY